jgi:hypothetical protein
VVPDGVPRQRIGRASDRFSKTDVVSPAAPRRPPQRRTTDATASTSDGAPGPRAAAPAAAREIDGGLQVRRTLERGAQSAAKATTHLDLSAARRTGVQMLEDVVIRFRQQLITQKRIGDFSNVTAGHDASILSSWAFTV